MNCLRCEQEMQTANFVTDVQGMKPYVMNREKGIFKTEKRSSITCYVCSKCGHIEFFADCPKNLR